MSETQSDSLQAPTQVDDEGELDAQDKFVVEVLQVDVAERRRQKRAPERQRLQTRYQDLLQAQGNALAEIRKLFTSPGSLDTGLRDHQAVAYLALRAHDLLANTVKKGPFETAAAKAEAALDTLEREGGALLELPLAQAAADQALAVLLDKIETAKGQAGPFAGVVTKIGESIQKERAGIPKCDKGRAERIVTGQGTLIARLDMIVETARVQAAISDKVGNLAPMLDPTPARTLREALEAADKQALDDLTKGNEVTAYDRVGTLHDDMVRLKDDVAQLRERAEKLSSDRGKAKGLSADQGKKLEPITKLVFDIKGDLTQTDGLAGRLEAMERVLAECVEQNETYTRLAGEIARACTETRTLPGSRRSAKDVIDSRLERAEQARQGKYDDGLRALNAINLYIAAFSEAATALFAANDRLAPIRNALPQALRDKFDRDRNSAAGYLDRQADRVGDARELAHGLLSRVEASAGYVAERAKYQNDIQALLLNKGIKGVWSRVNALDQAVLKSVVAEDFSDALTRLSDLANELPALKLYAETQTKTIDRASSAAGTTSVPGLAEAIRADIQQAANALATQQYPAIKEIVDRFDAILPRIAGFAANVGSVEALQKEIAGIGPAKDASDTKKADEAFETERAAIVAAKDLLASFDDRAKRLATLLAALEQARTERQAAAKNDLTSGGGSGKRLETLFSDPASTKLATDLYRELGRDDFVALLNSLGKDTDDVGPKAAAALKKLVDEIGAAGVKGLATDLGGPGKIGGLCGDDADPALPVGLQQKFANKPGVLASLMKDGMGGDATRLRAVCDGDADRAEKLATKFAGAMPALGSLLQDGLGGDNATIAALGKQTSADGADLKQISDDFPDRAKLSRLITTLGGAQAPDKLKGMLDTHFGGAWARLKSPFFDELEPHSDEVMAFSVNFQATSAVGQGQAPGDLHGFVSFSSEHVLDRHTPKHFKMTNQNIKPSNTQFEPSVDPAQIAGLAEEALEEAQKFRSGQDTSAVGVKLNNDYKQCIVPLLSHGIWVQVGYDDAGNVTQFFPLSPHNAKALANTFTGSDDYFDAVDQTPIFQAPTIKLQEINRDEMKAIKRAIGK